jgi:hypothetical protein
VLSLEDRLKLLAGSRLLRSWRRAVVVVQPKTILRWHLARGKVEQLGSFVGTNLVTVVGDYLAKVPIPTLSAGRIAGAAITTGDQDGGYVLVTGVLE